MLIVSSLVNFKTVLSRSAVGAVAGWVPREADSETEVNMQEVYYRGIGTDTCERDGREEGQDKRRSEAMMISQQKLKLKPEVHLPGDITLQR